MEVRHRLHGWRGFGLFGTLLVYANAADIMADPHQAVFWTAILPNAPFMDRSLMMIAFVFAAIGFGTKAGLFPMHTWLPDAHSEAPSPVSALLSGVLLKCAILIVLRFYILTAANVGATFPQTVMMILGVLSVCYAAFEVYKQNDLKRKLAYSSCENVGSSPYASASAAPSASSPGSCTALPTASPRPSCSACPAM